MSDGAIGSRDEAERRTAVAKAESQLLVLALSPEGMRALHAAEAGRAVPWSQAACDAINRLERRHAEPGHDPDKPIAMQALDLLGLPKTTVARIEAHRTSVPDVSDLPEIIGRIREHAQKRLNVRTVQRLASTFVSVAKNPDGASAKVPELRGLVEQIAEHAANTNDNKPRIELVSTAEIFAPLPPPKWTARDLQIGGGGRPTIIGAYGASAKTLGAQSMAVSVATGRPIWGHYACTQGRVVHVDYDQGKYATYRRYQRLALGMGVDPRDIGDRLQVSSSPRANLTSTDAYDAFCTAADGCSLMIVDSLRAAAPGIDENDSTIRDYIDVLSRVSETTAAAIVLIHHAGKPKDGHSDTRTILRGSSAIFDGAGCILVITPGKTNTDPRCVEQTKLPAEAEGALIEPFRLAVEDVSDGSNPTAGVRVVWSPVQSADPEAAADQKDIEDCDRLMRAVQESPGASTDTIRAKARMNGSRTTALLSLLAHEGRLRSVAGKHGSKTWWLVSS